MLDTFAPDADDDLDPEMVEHDDLEQQIRWLREVGQHVPAALTLAPVLIGLQRHRQWLNLPLTPDVLTYLHSLDPEVERLLTQLQHASLLGIGRFDSGLRHVIMLFGRPEHMAALSAQCHQDT